jgi:hypothetical protein
MEVSAKGKTLSMNGSAEYEDIIGSLLANLAPLQMEFKISGSLTSSEDRSDVLRNLGLDLTMKRSKAKSRYEVKISERTLPTEKLRDLYYKLMGKSVILLTAKPVSGSKEWSMSCKKSYPRPGMKGELKGPDTDFCKAIVPASDGALRAVMSEVLPDFSELVHSPFKQLRLSNLYRITDIVLPENKQNLGFSEVRTKAKRKGLLIRKVSVDGQEFSREVDFCV